MYIPSRRTMAGWRWWCAAWCMVELALIVVMLDIQWVMIASSISIPVIVIVVVIIILNPPAPLLHPCTLLHPSCISKSWLVLNPPAPLGFWLGLASFQHVEKEDGPGLVFLIGISFNYQIRNTDFTHVFGSTITVLLSYFIFISPFWLLQH